MSATEFAGYALGFLIVLFSAFVGAMLAFDVPRRAQRWLDKQMDDAMAEQKREEPRD